MASKQHPTPIETQHTSSEESVIRVSNDDPSKTSVNAAMYMRWSWAWKYVEADESFTNSRTFVGWKRIYPRLVSESVSE